MSPSSHPIKVLRCFVDETGDGAMFNRHGDVIIGTEGCSKYFILGFVLAEETNHIEKELDSLRHELCGDPYFKKVPSMQAPAKKTAMLFHAKDDVPEARWKVCRFIEKLDIKFSAVIINKEDTLAAVRARNLEDKNYRYKESESYELMTRELFKPFLLNIEYINHWLDISFAIRGNRKKTLALEKAIYDERMIIYNENFDREMDALDKIASIGEKAAILRDYYLSIKTSGKNEHIEETFDSLMRKYGELHEAGEEWATSSLKTLTAEIQREYADSGKLIQVNGAYPSQSPMLQVVDYCLWALQRYYERGEERYIEYIWGKVDRIEEIRPEGNRIYKNNDYIWGNKK